MDNCCDTGNFVAVGAGDWLYDGSFYSYPTGYCNHRCNRRLHSRAKVRLEERIFILKSLFAASEV